MSELDEVVFDKLKYIKTKYKIDNWFKFIRWIHEEQVYVKDSTNESFVLALDNLEDELKQF
jgi:hypothetical protein